MHISKGAWTTKLASQFYPHRRATQRYAACFAKLIVRTLFLNSRLRGPPPLRKFRLKPMLEQEIFVAAIGCAQFFGILANQDKTDL
jgi:hypothetical protein